MQQGSRVELRGAAQSSTRVSALMRNIDDSEWLREPGLDGVDFVTSGTERNAQFKVFAQQVSMVTPEGEAAEGSGAMSIVDELRVLDTSDPGRWPLPFRVGARSRSCSRPSSPLGIYMFVIKDECRCSDRAEREEVDLRGQFEDRQRKAANFDAYRAQLAEIERDFGAMLRQLPGKTEVPSLLVDISQTGLGAGLEEQQFTPTGRDPEGLLRGAADQAPLHGQLPRARQFCERHRCTAAHCDLT